MGFSSRTASPNDGLPRDRTTQRERPASLCALEGALVVIAGSGLIVALAVGAVVTFTGPNGWIAKAANTTVAGDANLVLTAYSAEGSR